MKEVFEALMEKLPINRYTSTGLIYHGKVYEVGLYEHLEAFKTIFEGDMLSMLERELESVDDVERSCQESADNGEHPEWHAVEMAESDARHRIMMAFYNDGGIRFFISANYHKQTFDDNERVYKLIFEGGSNGIGNISTLIYELKQREDVIDVDVHHVNLKKY